LALLSVDYAIEFFGCGNLLRYDDEAFQIG